MARLKLNLPEQFPFSTQLKIRITDINYANHLGNDAVLSLIHEGRLRFLMHLGFSEGNVDGVGIMVADAQIVYKSQGFYGDTVIIDVGVGEMYRVGCVFYYRLRNAATGKEIARAHTGVVFFDFEKQQLAHIPESFRRAVEKPDTNQGLA